MQVSLKIQESTPDIENAILSCLMGEIKPLFIKAAPKIQQRARELLLNVLRDSPEVASIRNGRLRDEFGLDDGASRIDAIIRSLVDSVSVRYKFDFSRRAIRASFVVEMVRRDFAYILELPEAWLITAKNQRLDWLEWLLLEGDKYIIRDYGVVFKPSRRSRTGNAIMVRQTGGMWRVPSEFSGTINDNFVTRAMEGMDKELSVIIQEELTR